MFPSYLGRSTTLAALLGLAAMGNAACERNEQPNKQPAARPSTECYGAWQFELGELASEPGLKVPDTWCLHLPRAFSVGLRREETGRINMTGTPFQPSDVMVGSGKCEFQFEGPTPGVPEHFSLIVEVPADDSGAAGTAKCTAWDPPQDGRRGGVGVVYPVKRTRQKE